MTSNRNPSRSIIEVLLSVLQDSSDSKGSAADDTTDNANGVLRCRKCLSSDVSNMPGFPSKYYQCADCTSVSKGIKLKADCEACVVCQKGYKAETTVVGCQKCHTWICVKCAKKIDGRYKCPNCRCNHNQTAVCGDRHYLDDISAEAKAVYMMISREMHFLSGHAELRPFMYEIIYEVHRYLTATSKYLIERGDQVIRPLTEFVPSPAILGIWQFAVCLTETYPALCEAIAGKGKFIHFTPIVLGNMDNKKMACNELMQRAPNFRAWSGTVWTTDNTEKLSAAIICEPAGELKIILGDGLTMLGPYHPKYTGADLAFKLKLKKCSLVTEAGKKVDGTSMLSAQGIQSGDTLRAVKATAYSLDN